MYEKRRKYARTYTYSNLAQALNWQERENATLLTPIYVAISYADRSGLNASVNRDESCTKHRTLEVARVNANRDYQVD